MRILSEDSEWVEQLDKWHLLTPLRIIIILVLAIIATLVVRHIVTKMMGRIYVRSMPSDYERTEARSRALSSALRGALVGIIWTVAVITMISVLGINVGAMIATATIIGGALAFGAQTMVRDVIAGFFVLADDQYGVGDVVDLGHARGTVERVTLRGARLRDGEGVIWYVAHGNVNRVGNLTKTSVAWLDVEVGRSNKIESVLRVSASLGEALCQDDDTARLLLSTPIPVGVVDLADDRMVFRCSVTTQPGHRDDVKRAWRTLVLGAFERGELTAPTVPYIGHEERESPA